MGENNYIPIIKDYFNAHMHDLTYASFQLYV